MVNDHTTVVMDDGTRAEMLQPAGEVVAMLPLVAAANDHKTVKVATRHLLVVGAAMDYGR